MSLNHKNFALLVMLPLLVILTACNSTRTPTPPLTNPTVISQSITHPPSPSSTPFPDSPIYTHTADYQGTQRAQTYNKTATAIALFPSTCHDAWHSMLSPSGEWLALSCSLQQDQTLEIMNRDGRKIVMEFPDFLAPEDKTDWIPMGGLYPIRWTNNERYLYFSSTVSLDGGGICFYGFGQSGLFRVDLLTGETSAILSPRSEWDGYQISFSPDGRYLAYAVINAYIKDLVTGQLTEIESSGDIVGSLTWSPDGSKLAYATCKPNLDTQKVMKSAIKIYTVKSSSRRTLLEVNDDFLDIESGIGDPILKISNENQKTFEDTYLYFDWGNEELITPTPEP